MLLKEGLPSALLAKGFSQAWHQVWGLERVEKQGSWKDMPLDYYIYSSFTENPSNQCLVHSKAACSACLAACDNSGYAGSARVLSEVSRPRPGHRNDLQIATERLWEQPALLLHGAGTLDPVGRALRWEGAAARVGVAEGEGAALHFTDQWSHLFAGMPAL